MLARILPWVFLFGLLSMFGTVFKLFFLPEIKGRLGEANINFWIRRRLDQETYHRIPDVTLPTPDGTTQIDHVIPDFRGNPYPCLRPPEIVIISLQENGFPHGHD